MSKSQVTVGLNVFITLEADVKSIHVIAENVRTAVARALARDNMLYPDQHWIETEVQLDPGATVQVKL
jgi:hypothetical protein